MIPGRGHFWPQGSNLNKLCRGQPDDASYQISRHYRPCGFRQADFFKFLPIKAYVKPVTPEAGHFWPQGYNLNKLGRGSLDDTTTKD